MILRKRYLFSQVVMFESIGRDRVGFLIGAVLQTTQRRVPLASIIFFFADSVGRFPFLWVVVFRVLVAMPADDTTPSSTGGWSQVAPSQEGDKGVEVVDDLDDMRMFWRSSQSLASGYVRRYYCPVPPASPLFRYFLCFCCVL